MTGREAGRPAPAEGAPQGRPERGPAGRGRGGSGRWSAQRKREVVLRMLRGEDLELLSRELRVTAAKLCEWRDDFLAAGEAGLKSRDVPDVRDVEIKQLYAKIGELTMERELQDDLVRRFKERGVVPFEMRSSR